ncbi:hypothetical protein SAT01_04240 [Sinomonas atrocyanea]|nr:hypothetical protein SAT01_04240 [Sinomonas atrocyanea]GGG61808.1 hypothetical protein GCM10007172_11130 [Sinomonas atrocyanea]
MIPWGGSAEAPHERNSRDPATLRQSQRIQYRPTQCATSQSIDYPENVISVWVEPPARGMPGSTGESARGLLEHRLPRHVWQSRNRATTALAGRCPPATVRKSRCHSDGTLEGDPMGAETQHEPAGPVYEDILRQIARAKTHVSSPTPSFRSSWQRAQSAAKG